MVGLFKFQPFHRHALKTTFLYHLCRCSCWRDCSDGTTLTQALVSYTYMQTVSWTNQIKYFKPNKNISKTTILQIPPLKRLLLNKQLFYCINSSLIFTNSDTLVLSTCHWVLLFSVVYTELQWSQNWLDFWKAHHRFTKKNEWYWRLISHFT